MAHIPLIAHDLRDSHTTSPSLNYENIEGHFRDFIANECVKNDGIGSCRYSGGIEVGCWNYDGTGSCSVRIIIHCVLCHLLV